MAVIIKNNYPENKEELELKINNCDLKYMEEVLLRWNFKDIQSFWRFSVSILLETEEKELWIKDNGKPIRIAPADHSIKA